jgi:hypothetical protein
MPAPLLDEQPPIRAPPHPAPRGAGCRLGLDRSTARPGAVQPTGDCTRTSLAASLPPRLPVAALRMLCAPTQHPPGHPLYISLLPSTPFRPIGAHRAQFLYTQSEQTRAKRQVVLCYVMSSRIRLRPARGPSAVSCGFCRARKRAGARRALAPSAAEGGRVVADIRVSGGWGCLVRATEAHTACLPGVEAHRR